MAHDADEAPVAAVVWAGVPLGHRLLRCISSPTLRLSTPSRHREAGHGRARSPGS